MIRIFTVVALLLLPMYGMATSFYTVNLTIYKNKKALDKKLSNFSPALRKTIVIKKNKNMYRVKTLLTKNKKFLTKLLPSYRKVFPDAFIAAVPFSKNQVNPKVPSKQKKIPVKKPNKEDNTFLTLLQNQTFYLSPVLKVGENKKFLIKVTFTVSNVTYTPILGKVPPMSALYKVEDNKLFLYQKGLLNTKVFSLLEESRFKYHLISSWIDNKRVKNLRYYLNLHDAKAYLNSL